MPTVEFLPTGKRVDAPEGTELLSAARAAGVELRADCGGQGRCGRCALRLLSGQVDCDGLGKLSPEQVAQGWVLACQAKVRAGPLRVQIPEPEGPEAGQLEELDEAHRVAERRLRQLPALTPLVATCAVDIPPAEEGASPDAERLLRACAAGNILAPDAAMSLAVLRQAPQALRAEGGLVTVAISRTDSPPHILRVEPGDTTPQSHGLAADLGTTSVAVQIVDLNTGQVRATRSAYNAQVACGLDVISRINYARRPQGLAELRTRALGTLNALAAQAARDAGTTPDHLLCAALSGNTTMVHLLLGIEPEHIRLAPYVPAVLDVPVLSASAVGLAVCPDAPVWIAPGVGSYVGGDIIAGLLCTDLAGRSGDLRLFIDIGTNGELVLGGAEFLIACACSAGPAFEGGGIRCGMRAAAGAIEKVQVDPESARPQLGTIGGGPPRGICGSGMIDLVAELRRTGWLDPAGRLDRSRPAPNVRVDGRRASYLLAPADETATGEDLIISETEIDSLLRAKAAVYAAASLLLKQVGVAFGDLAEVCIAGAFGRFLDLDHATAIGLVPDLPRDRFRFLGNASLAGSYLALASHEHRLLQKELARRTTYLDLSTTPDYMDQYTAALFLPHTDPTRFPSVKAGPERPRP